MEKKSSDHFRDILNPYGEKSNYGKIGRRRHLSKLNVLFFSIILSVTIYYILLYYILLYYILLYYILYYYILLYYILLYYILFYSIILVLYFLYTII